MYVTNRFTDDVDDPAQRGLPHGDGDGRARVSHGLATHQAFGAVHGYGAAGALAQVLCHLQNQPRRCQQSSSERTPISFLLRK
jgi:hypothetical protein